MKNMLDAFYTKPLVIYLAIALVVLSSLSGPAEAMFMPAAPQIERAGMRMGAVNRASDLAKIQTALESKVLRQRLMDYGFSMEETMTRINKLSDQQIHEIAANMDSMQAGGDAVGAVIGLLIIALLVVLLIYLLEGRIEIRRR